MSGTHRTKQCIPHSTTILSRHNSQIRQVPDNQEVYLDKDGFTSIVFDILERVEVGEKTDIDALKYHLQDIIEDDTDETKTWTLNSAIFSKLP